MKAWQWQAPEKLRLVELPRPVPKRNEALIRVEAVGVCGSDIHYFLEGAIGENRLTAPTVLGHEYA
ncbi:MAG TPA: alcohol dehydrogenase catalytic domain-containing protein, partial [Candidatus Hydrogenedentes bacterium]|nr:alcohol dehydrogenase catalytic domain-containing protein [Candidatus Hydrogenedentota bacterium]